MADPSQEIPSNYTAPQILSGVANFLSFTRFSGSTDFADLVSPELNEQKNYTYGMVFLVTIMVTGLFLWASVLIVLKYHGDASGCAAGKPFQTSSNESTVRSSVSHPSTQNETFDSLSLESRTQDMENAETAQSSTRESKGSSKDSMKAAKRRQLRTRIVFIVFGVMVLVCTALLLVFSFSSFRTTVDGSEETTAAAQDIVNQVQSTVRTVESAVDYANETLWNITMDIKEVCPNYTSAQDLGVDLDELTVILRDEFQTLETVGAVNMTQINRTLTLVQNGLDRFQATVNTADEKMWVFPLILLIVFVTATAMLVGAVLSWTGKSSSNFERKMAYGVLPILIIMAVVCWLLALGAAIASLVTSDACVDPDATVQAILQEYNVDMNSTTAQLIAAYTNGCQGEDPTEVFTEFEENLQTAVDSIWRTISIADSIGREEVSLRCGNDVDPILDGARNLARSLTWTRKALISSIASLQCGPIHEIYLQAVHDSFCTEGGTGLAWAFILFSVVGIGSMVMVSLRASLYNHVDDEEVYHENDEADNMILNEHEEYLAYISRYKHEWEEYRGLNPAEPFDQTEQAGEDSIESIIASESWTERGEDDTGIEGDSWDVDSEGPQLTASDSEHDYGSIDSCPTDDISFLSLPESQRNSLDQGDGDSPVIPSILGPPPGEPDEAWDQEPDFFLGDKNCHVTVPAATNESEEPNVEVHLSPTFVPDKSNMSLFKSDPPVVQTEPSAGGGRYEQPSVGETKTVPDKSVPQAQKEGMFNFTKHLIAPEMLDNIKLFGRSNEDRSATIKEASPKMKHKYVI